jgi:hypothetical protein
VSQTGAGPSRRRQFIVVEKRGRMSRSLPGHSDLVAQADDLDELLDLLAAKVGAEVTRPHRAPDGGGDGTA